MRSSRSFGGEKSVPWRYRKLYVIAKGKTLAEATDAAFERYNRKHGITPPEAPERTGVRWLWAARVGELGERSKEAASHGDALKAVEDSFYFPLPVSTHKENVLACADKDLPAVISALYSRDRAIAHHLHDMNIEFVWLRALGSD